MRATKSIHEVDIGESELLRFLLNLAFNNGYAVAAWSLPDADTKRILISRKIRTMTPDFSLEELPFGFLFASFDRDKNALFLEADYTFTVNNGKLAQPSDENETYSHEWLQKNLPASETSHKTPVRTYAGIPAKEHTKEHFIALVEKGLREVESGVFEKIVPSRSKSVALPANFDVADAFFHLCKAYSHAFVSLTSSPESGTWLGASPEELVRVFDKTIFKTVALAGTQPYREGQNLRNVSWTQKEIEEQALVERYIISCFKKIRLREYDEHGPKTVIAGNLMHLRSEFTVNLKETNFPQLGSVMLQLLHPTSAVCGMPLENALEFLKNNEGYERSFYSGYLGPVNCNNEINIFVNLRCMQIIGGNAILYAGAGVTVDSIAEEEWAETEMKMNTLLTVIQQPHDNA